MTAGYSFRWLIDLLADRLTEASHFAHVDAAARFVAAIEPFLAGAL